MAVFISYSGRDKELLTEVLAALHHAHEQVWLDQALRGGEAWWREILGQIRDCELFIMALSQHSLESQLCRAQLAYAQALDKPILPLQIGRVDSMRVNPLAAMQIIDYRNPGLETGIELIDQVRAGRARLKPLPDPLPKEPLMPSVPLRSLDSVNDDQEQQQPAPPPQHTGTRQINQPIAAAGQQRAQPEAPQEAEPTSSGPLGDRVSSSVFAPPAVECGNTFLVQAFAHLPEQAALAESLAHGYDDAAQRRGSFALDSRVMEGERLSFELLLPGLVVDDSHQSLVWTGKPASVQFGVTVPTHFSPKTVVGTVTVSRDLVPMGHVKFKLQVCQSRTVTVGEETPQARWNMHRYSRAFLSYASHDRNEVLKRTQMLAGVHVDFFQDLLTLEPGQRWERQLYTEIDRCDLFLLFWSSAAKKSEWVRKEVNYAIARHGGDDLAPPEILPVIIEGPPPVPPPPELAHLHFNDRMIYFMNPTQKHRFSLLRRRGG
jgi:hypothetical protein